MPAGSCGPSRSVRRYARVDSDGARINYRVWGEPGLPGLVLLHGGSAHSGGGITSARSSRSHRVVAPDLTGHGDSDRRTEYDLITWAREVLTVIAAEGLDKPVVVGHSMGGWVSATIGAMYGDQITAIAILDSPLNDQPPEEERLQERRQPTKVYASVEEAVAALQDDPAAGRGAALRQGPHRPAVAAARRGRLDLEVRSAAVRTPDPAARTSRRSSAAPAALFRSEHGLVTPEMAEEMAQIAGEQFAVVDVPAAGHHPMLDQPLALVTGLRTLFTFWPAPALIPGVVGPPGAASTIARASPDRVELIQPQRSRPGSDELAEDGREDVVVDRHPHQQIDGVLARLRVVHDREPLRPGLLGRGIQVAGEAQCRRSEARIQSRSAAARPG